MKSWIKLRALFRKEKLDAEMAEEMRAHLELQTTENRKRGMSADEARCAARRQFGGVEQIKERARDARGLRWMHDFIGDVRFALRMIAKAPVMSAVIVLSLALGLGANTAVFSWIHTVALEPLPGVPDGRHLMLIEQRNRSGLIEFSSPAEWRDLRQQAASFADLAAHNVNTFLRQGLTAVIGGIVVEWVGAYFASVRLSRELVEVPAGDRALFIGLPLVLGAVAVLACWLPARRAAKVDPLVALRCE